MPSRTELIQQQKQIDGALNDLIRQGEVGPQEQRDELGTKYSELWEIREQVNQELAALPAPNLPARVPAVGAAVPQRRVRWGVLAVGGMGVLSLIGLIGWQMYRQHGKRKVRRKKRK